MINDIECDERLIALANQDLRAFQTSLYLGGDRRNNKLQTMRDLMDALDDQCDLALAVALCICKMAQKESGLFGTSRATHELFHKEGVLQQAENEFEIDAGRIRQLICSFVFANQARADFSSFATPTPEDLLDKACAASGALGEDLMDTIFQRPGFSWVEIIDQTAGDAPIEEINDYVDALVALENAGVVVSRFGSIYLNPCFIGVDEFDVEANMNKVVATLNAAINNFRTSPEIKEDSPSIVEQSKLPCSSQRGGVLTEKIVFDPSKNSWTSIELIQLCLSHKANGLFANRAYLDGLDADDVRQYTAERILRLEKSVSGDEKKAFAFIKSVAERSFHLKGNSEEITVENDLPDVEIEEPVRHYISEFKLDAELEAMRIEICGSKTERKQFRWGTREEIDWITPAKENGYADEEIANAVVEAGYPLHNHRQLTNWGKNLPIVIADIVMGLVTTPKAVPKEPWHPFITNLIKSQGAGAAKKIAKVFRVQEYTVRNWGLGQYQPPLADQITYQKVAALWF
ncbi:MAG: hypothetical protein ABIK25_07310 [Pseudomonadota bacterium]